LQITPKFPTTGQSIQSNSFEKYVKYSHSSIKSVFIELRSNPSGITLFISYSSFLVFSGCHLSQSKAYDKVAGVVSAAPIKNPIKSDTIHETFLGSSLRRIARTQLSHI